jgi:5-methylcytosine-specific restriction endonuclease McrA
VSRTYIPAALRRQVIERAKNCCEYCLIHEDDVSMRHEVDHIIAEKHGGTTTEENLAYACFLCNNNKGSDIASLSRSGIVTRLFQPRSDIWAEHFRLDNAQIVPITDIGEATEWILGFNTTERCEERRGLIALDRYPLL